MPENLEMLEIPYSEAYGLVRDKIKLAHKMFG